MHKALENYYEKVIELIDELVESVSGIYGRPRGYKSYEIIVYKEDNVFPYFTNLYSFVEENRKNVFQESWIQNKIDEIAFLVARTIYMLTLK